ncbi:MAG: 4Fe-4S ferredoxin, partial [Lentimicrobiaceae bacterium]|nr:4Fe-4S ferredoxin [Lentimicrobiaceae bacterium]
LDSNKESYIEKIAEMISISQINTLTVMMMEVPCCSGLMQMVQLALLKAERKITVKQIIVSIQGEVLKEEWL